VDSAGSGWARACVRPRAHAISQREGVLRCRENHPWQTVSARPPVQGAPRMLPCRCVITGPGTDGRLLGGSAASQWRIAGERGRLRRKSGDPDHLSPLADGTPSPRRIRRRPERLRRRHER
jgi:hypothetical protein